jgi:phospholipid/cholesterol/gamma-HCH transport system ATP-binding protein
MEQQQQGQDITQQEKGEPVISISHLKKSFSGNTILSDINLTLQKGENLVVLGRSGTGKSVTIKCIVGLLQPDEGSIKVFGEEVTTMTDQRMKELRMHTGFLFQSGALYDSMTVRENLEFPLRRVLKIKDKSELDHRVADILEGVGLPEAADKMPSELSGGMRKRIGLARTMILQPEIILYDEPTTGLDPITSREISDLMLQMQEKYHVSAIIITHDIPCARITANRIMVLDKGTFIAEGSFDELQKAENELVRAFFK